MVIHGWVASFLMEGFVELNTGRAEAGWKYGPKTKGQPRRKVGTKSQIQTNVKETISNIHPKYLVNS